MVLSSVPLIVNIMERVVGKEGEEGNSRGRDLWERQ